MEGKQCHAGDVAPRILDVLSSELLVACNEAGRGGRKLDFLPVAFELMGTLMKYASPGAGAIYQLEHRGIVRRSPLL